ncbi:MAG: sugar phosphate isomerase/epimerase [Candidatus Solibacter usitatus]|nr:sugar phosphate isomerase/epimerase [Candidatus Solibacter usitatus]
MAELFPTAAITDEFSPDLETAARSMAELGMRGAELRLLFGKNIIDLTDDELARARQIVEAHGLHVISIASPVLKCTLPDAPPIDPRFQQDMFASNYTFADQPRLARRAFAIAGLTGARIVRVFSYWRTLQPDACFERVVSALCELADQAKAHDLIIGLENEHACNISTAEETARVLAAIDHPNLKVVWDPANAYLSGEIPFPDGYRLLPAGRIVHVHAKDCFVRDHRPVWGPLGEGGVDWKGQIGALRADGYRGYISLETHWAGPAGDKHLGSMICGRNLKALVASGPAHA